MRAESKRGHIVFQHKSVPDKIAFHGMRTTTVLHFFQRFPQHHGKQQTQNSHTAKRRYHGFRQHTNHGEQAGYDAGQPEKKQDKNRKTEHSNLDNQQYDADYEQQGGKIERKRVG